MKKILVKIYMIFLLKSLRIIICSLLFYISFQFGMSLELVHFIQNIALLISLVLMLWLSPGTNFREDFPRSSYMSPHCKIFKQCHWQLRAYESNELRGWTLLESLLYLSSRLPCSSGKCVHFHSLRFKDSLNLS